ncbi:MAG: hypothetical protein J0H99_24070, partial [Rhodospirillales bacterium]|nr:hypothetical protein [Rhodospirillales bacterium]
MLRLILFAYAHDIVARFHVYLAARGCFRRGMIFDPALVAADARLETVRGGIDAGVGVVAFAVCALMSEA